MRFRSCVSGSVEAVPDRSGIGASERSFVGVACFVLILSASAQAQFFKVYPYKTADAGAVEVSYWTTFISSSDGGLEFSNGERYSREDLWAHSVELEETREEHYAWSVPSGLAGREVYLKASLWYRRMADSHAEHLDIDRRPYLLVSQDERRITIVDGP